MTTLTEFLATADTDNAVALGQARAFSEQDVQRGQRCRAFSTNELRVYNYVR